MNLKNEVLNFMMDTTLYNVKHYKADLLRDIETLTNLKEKLHNGSVILWAVRESGTVLIHKEMYKEVALDYLSFYSEEKWYVLKNIYLYEKEDFSFVEIDVEDETISHEEILTMNFGDMLN